MCIISNFDCIGNTNDMKFLSTIKKLMNIGVNSSDLTDTEKSQLNQAVVGMMVEMIRADFVELQKERDVLSDVVCATLGLGAEEAARLIGRAELQSDFSLSLNTQSTVINNFMGREEKRRLICNLWLLANADNELHLLEENLLYEAAEQLGFDRNQVNQVCATATNE